MAGGAPFTENIAIRWGANGYGKGAHHALRAAVSIMRQIEAGSEVKG
ncbi:MAG: hypothetical protein ACOY30_08465 [Bacillota bacterium]